MRVRRHGGALESSSDARLCQHQAVDQDHLLVARRQRRASLGERGGRREVQDGVRVRRCHQDRRKGQLAPRQPLDAPLPRDVQRWTSPDDDERRARRTTIANPQPRLWPRHSSRSSRVVGTRPTLVRPGPDGPSPRRAPAREEVLPLRHPHRPFQVASPPQHGIPDARPPLQLRSPRNADGQ
jgi:hypothetical protein